MPAELDFVVFGVAEGITCTKYFEMYLSLSPDEELPDAVDPVELLDPLSVSEPSGVVREGVSVNPREQLGVLSVRERVLVGHFEPSDVLKVTEGVSVNPDELFGVLSVREGVLVGRFMPPSVREGVSVNP